MGAPRASPSPLTKGRLRLTPVPDARRGAGLKPAPTLFAAGARLSSHRRVCGLRANWLMVDKKGPAPPTSPDRRPSGRRNDVAARHHLVLQPRVSTVAVSTRRSGGDLWDRGSDRSDLERASPASGRFTNRPYVASPSLCERDGIFRLACTAESALTLRIRTLQLQAPS